MIKELVSIVILSYNQLEYTKFCLESIRKYTTDVPYEIIIIDNASDMETVNYLKEQKDILLILNQYNRGFAGGCNEGIKLAEGEYVLLLNNDTIVTSKWLYHMWELLRENREIAMTGPLTNATVGKQMIEVPYGENMEEMQAFAEKISESKEKPWRTLRLVAFCTLIRKQIFDEIGMFDENFAVGNYEDDDFNIRSLLAKKKMYICRNSFIHHFMNVSFKQKNIQRERIMMKNKLLLEDKWDLADWNHHAVYNKYMLNTIIEHGGKNILHIGCGLGALAVELKDLDNTYRIVGIEEHPIRKKIAQEFLDKLYTYDEWLEEKRKIFDVIIVECMLEKKGIDLLERVKEYSSRQSLVLLRVFNANHITSLERVVTGKVEGNLLCASSKEFSYYYADDFEGELGKMNYSIMERREIIKRFSNLENELYEAMQQYMTKPDECRIYNRIYNLKWNNGEEVNE